MDNCQTFIQNILNTTSDELLLKYWKQKLEKRAAEKKEELAAHSNIFQPELSENYLDLTLEEFMQIGQPAYQF